VLVYSGRQGGVIVKRLDLLKKELEIVKNMDCLALNIKEQAIDYYNHEIDCIEKYGSANPEYGDKCPKRKFFNIDLREIKDV
jgi:hypothetical protein